MKKLLILATVIFLFIFMFFRYEKTYKIFYGPRYCIQRLFGYNDFYDKIADLILNIQNRTINFLYNGKEWRIELWKGKYWIFIGGEVGIYYKRLKQSLKHYNAVFNKDMIEMDLELYYDNKLLFKRPYKKYWWVNGFKYNMLKKVSPDELKLHTLLTFKDQEARYSFFKAYIDKFDSSTIQLSTDKAVIIDF